MCFLCGWFEQAYEYKYPGVHWLDLLCNPKRYPPTRKLPYGFCNAVDTYPAIRVKPTNTHCFLADKLDKYAEFRQSCFLCCHAVRVRNPNPYYPDNFICYRHKWAEDDKPISIDIRRGIVCWNWDSNYF